MRAVQPKGKTSSVRFRLRSRRMNALSDPIFQTAIKNSPYYAVIWVPLTMALGLALAVIVNQKIHGRTFFRAAFYFPAIASSAAIATLFIFIMAPDGLFNRVRAVVGLNPLFSLLGFSPSQNWIGDQGTARDPSSEMPPVSTIDDRTPRACDTRRRPAGLRRCVAIVGNNYIAGPSRREGSPTPANDPMRTTE